MSHYVYLVRHGEQQDAEHGITDGHLSERGRAQAHQLGRRLQGVPFSAFLTSPLDRALETADIVSQYVQGPPVEQSTLLFDCIPSGRTPDTPSWYDGYFAGIPQPTIDAGQAQMEDATDTFLTSTRDDTHTLLVTHNFVVGWFVRHVLEAPTWRWLGLQQNNCALTVVRVRTAKPSELLIHNDVSHLESSLRTGVGWSLPV